MIKFRTSSPQMPWRSERRHTERGAMGWVFLWLIGIPIPILLVLFLVRGCT